jgi:hypothetical protein
MSGAVFSGNVAMLLPWRGHARVEDLHFRVVAMFEKPVGCDKI